MNGIQAMFDWLRHNPSATAFICYAAAVVGVVLYGYLYKFEMLTHRD